ncbi:MAG: glycoside hydrolase family 125 protein, partial [Clostridia bacterium]|nr:glycoside hydrolase family 125 protein [Clostridia bacterium]
VRAMKSVKMLSKLLNDEDSYKEAARLEKEIAEGVEAYGKVQHPELGEIYAYETDGYGNYVFMDDANVPSLLALPYLEVCEKDDPLYKRTRAFVLSKHNPYYYEGSLAKGVGSPHSPAGYIWPIALCVQAMTSTDDTEIASLLKNVLATTGGTGFMHESFDPNKPEDFTRPWFAWANSMLAENVMRLYEEGKLEKILKMAKGMYDQSRFQIGSGFSYCLRQKMKTSDLENQRFSP